MTRAAPVVVQDDVSGDPKEPRAPVRRLWPPASTDAQKDFLRQVARRVTLADRPAEIPEDPLVIRREQPLGIGHGSLLPKDAGGG